MNSIFGKPYRWAGLFSIVMILAVSLVLLDTFVIPKAGIAVTTTSTDTTNPSLSETTAISAGGSTSETGMQSTSAVSSNSYQDGNIQITIETIRKYDTTIYIADVIVSSAEYLKTAFAQNTYGRNIKDSTSNIAEDSGAIFAVNGDYYGFRNTGFVIRNGILYRDSAATAVSSEGLAIDSQGNFTIIDEKTTAAQDLADSGVWQVLSFGPALVIDGEIAVSSDDEVGRAMASNPRTAIGQISPLHYVFIVSDGRTSESAGLSLLELAGIFQERGCTVAYNLDGGGSSTMWFNGQVVNNPTDGRTASERKVSDIVYIGY
jgi:exopolysaccharide biosynthesis protein